MKKINIFILFLLFTVAIFAQGFKSFTVNGQIYPALIKDNAKGASQVEVIVNDQVDITNVDFDYRLYSRSREVNKISPDFSKPQFITINKRDVGDKLWKIEVKPLVPSSLPFELNFSKNNPSIWDISSIGWAGIGIDTRKNTVIRFGNHNVSFFVAFNEDAQSVSYDLIPVSKAPVEFAGKFTVEVSADGKEWKTLHVFDDNNNFNSSNSYTHPLEKGIRYIKWTYVERLKLNINLNNIKIIPYES